MFKRIIVTGTARWVVLAVLTLLAGVVALLLMGSGSLSTADDQVRIQQTVRSALMVRQQLGVPNIQLPGQKDVIHYSGGPMPNDIQQKMLARIPDQLGKYYKGEPFSRYTSLLQNSVRREQSGAVQYLDGGVDSVTYTSIAINGNTARVTADAVIWARMAQDRGNGQKPVEANPHNTINCVFTLAKQPDGRWLIDSETWTFAPGSEP